MRYTTTEKLSCNSNDLFNFIDLTTNIIVGWKVKEKYLKADRLKKKPE